MEQIVTKIDSLTEDIAEVKSEVAEVKSEVVTIKADMLEVKFAQIRFGENLKAIADQMTDLKTQTRT